MFGPVHTLARENPQRPIQNFIDYANVGFKNILLAIKM